MLEFFTGVFTLLLFGVIWKEFIDFFNKTFKLIFSLVLFCFVAYLTGHGFIKFCEILLKAFC
jgi:hypothetical protein